MKAKNRLLVLTDISSLQSGVREPDDGQSLIRLLLYANDIDLEGFVASSNMGHGQTVRPELIHQAIAAYGQVRPNLLKHDAAYPAPAKLDELVHAGQPIAGPKVPVESSIGEAKDTPASNWIIAVTDKAVADENDTRPLWIAMWGGAADLAQALWRVRATRPAEQVEKFVSKLRAHSVYDQDSTGAWIKENFPALFFITRHHGIRGMYRGGAVNLVSSDWVKQNIHGHGALGDLYPDYNGGDIWSGKLGRVRGIKEGDTPSFLGLIPNGLGDPTMAKWQPSWGGWGGRFQKTDEAGRRWTDVADNLSGHENDPDPRVAALYRWRPHWQNDFAARLDWCVRDFQEANHAPLARIEGETHRRVRPGDEIVLDGRASRDPDGNELHFHWWHYADAGNCQAQLNIENAQEAIAKLKVPRVETPCEMHIVLTLRDNGAPPLFSYARIVLGVEP